LKQFLGAGSKKGLLFHGMLDLQIMLEFVNCCLLEDNGGPGSNDSSFSVDTFEELKGKLSSLHCYNNSVKCCAAPHRAI
jgi:hypothetical protein